MSNKVPYPVPVNGAGMRQPEVPALQLVAPIPAPPQPTATHFAVGRARISGHEAIVLQVATPAGVQFYFMPPDVAKTVAANLAGAATEASSGIMLVPG